jgi:ribosomal protein L11 methyltransferase
VRAEEARATMLELFASGFEEVERGAILELAAYTDAAGERRLRDLFGAVRSRAVGGDWSQRWREFHRSVVVGPLWVGPPWEQPADGLLPVVIDPGRAFGTGRHETTRLCLSFLVDLPRGPLLDVGCGSGVLAIAAARLGFAPVVALDSDEAAVAVTVANARANGVSIAVRHADALADTLPATETAVANVDVSLVSSLAPRLGVRRLVASGYLDSAHPSAPGFRRVERRTDGDWAADLYVRE